MDHDAFFDALRPHLNLTDRNVLGTGEILDYAGKRDTDLLQLAYILPTAWWESAQTMHPVREAYWLSEDWRRRHLRYYPWYGRGLIQTTWKRNYARMGQEIGVSLLTDPDRLLTWECALPALFVGMEKGLYTGKSLDDYIDALDEPDAEDLKEYVRARRIVNGTDRALTIAKLALVFEHALKAGGWQGARTTRRVLIVLARGSTGGDVRDLQKAMGITADGIFGPVTQRAVEAYQRAHGLAVDGIAGPKTLAALRLA